MPAGFSTLLAMLHVCMLATFSSAFVTHVLTGAAKHLEVIGAYRHYFCSCQANSRAFPVQQNTRDQAFYIFLVKALCGTFLTGCRAIVAGPDAFFQIVHGFYF
jgi:hypothetical protein